MTRHVSIGDDLFSYLQERAKLNFRTPSGEVAAILTRLKAGKISDADKAGDEVVTNETEPVGEHTEAAETTETGFRKGPYDTISGYFGVYNYGKRWMARIVRDGAVQRIGVFDDPEEAAIAYDAVVRAGEVGRRHRLNFPDSSEDTASHAEDKAPPTKGPYATASGYFGVHPYGKRWRACITRDGATRQLGVFDDPEAAAIAYDNAVRSAGTERGAARLNFPSDEEKQTPDTASTPIRMSREVMEITGFARSRNSGNRPVTNNDGDDQSGLGIPDGFMPDLNGEVASNRVRAGLVAAGMPGVAPPDYTYEPPYEELGEELEESQELPATPQKRSQLKAVPPEDD